MNKPVLRIWNEKVTDKDQLYLRLGESEDKEKIVLFMVDHTGQPIEGGCLFQFILPAKIIVINKMITDKYPLKTTYKDEPMIISFEDVERQKDRFAKLAMIDSINELVGKSRAHVEDKKVRH